MAHYCTLTIQSDRVDAPETHFQSSAVGALEFEDNFSPSRLASSQRMRAVGFIQRSDLPRYAWSLDSRKAIGADETDPCAHVAWLLSQLEPSVSLRDVESRLSLHWGGNGTGGGPFISPTLAGLLQQHQIGLDVGFYYEESDAA